MRKLRGRGAAVAAAMVLCCAAGVASGQGADVIVGELPDVSNLASYDSVMPDTSVLLPFVLMVAVLLWRPAGLAGSRT